MGWQMIILDNVTKYYFSKKNNEKISALKNITCSFAEQGMVFILGKSGSGKSTLLNVISGLDNFDEGSIEVSGRKLEKLNDSEMDNYRSTNVGFIFQDFILINDITVYDNIKLALAFDNISDKRELISSSLKSVGLEGYSDRFPYELSGGEKQRVAIARALVRNPRIVFADEPTGNLDSETGNQILDILKILSQNILIFIVTHDSDSCKNYADRILNLKDGKIEFDKINNSTISDLKEDPIEISIKSQNIPVKVALSLAYSNFKSRIMRSMISILLFCIALISMTCTMALLFYNTNDGIHLTVKNNQTEYLFFYNIEYDRYGNAVKTFSYINRLYINNAMSNTLFMMIPNVGFNTLILGGPSKYVLNNKIEVDSVSDVILFGLVFYDNQYIELNENSVLINDFSIASMKDDTRRYFENTYTPQYIFYLNDDGHEVPLHSINYRYGELVGKEIRVYSPIDENTRLFMDSFEISGIYKTDYLDYIDENFNMKNNLTDDELANWMMNWNHLYKTYVSNEYSNTHEYLPGVFYGTDSEYGTLSSSAFEKRSYTLQITDNINLYETNISIGRYDDLSDIDRYIVLENDGIITSDYILKDNEILINLDTYNLLNETSLQPQDFIDNGTIVSFPYTSEMTLSIKVFDDDLDKRAYDENYKVVGVFIDENEQYDVNSVWINVYLNDSTVHNLYKVYHKVYSVISVYINDNYDELPKLIKDFSDNGMYPDFEYSNTFYAHESNIRQTQTLMLIISIATLFTSSIMIINVISVSINAKKKEIGILRAMGYSKAHISSIFLYESLLLGSVTLLIVLGLQPIIINILNAVIAKADNPYIKFFSVNILTILIIFAVAILIPIISTAFSVFKISSLKPAECIKKSD